MKSLTPSKDLTLESLRGSCGHDLTLGITRNPPAGLVGLHRFEPVERNWIAPAPGNVTYPTRNFAQICYSQAFYRLMSWPFLPASAYRYAARTISSSVIWSQKPGV